MAMIVAALTLIAAFLGGFIGTLLAHRLQRRKDARPYQPPVDPWTASEIDRVAAGWAAAAGEPAAEGLLAEKLRMAFALRNQRPPYDQGGW